MDAFKKNYCVDFGTPPNVDQKKLLRPQHAYTMVILNDNLVGSICDPR